MYMSVYIKREIKLCTATTMEAALLATNVAMSLSTFTKKNLLLSQLNRHFSTIRPSQLVCSRLNRVELQSLNRFGGSVSLSRGFGAVDLRRLGKKQSVQCVGSSAASFASGGGGFVGKDGNGGGGGGGGGDGAAEGGEAKPSAANVAGAEDVSALSSDVIILDVTGMTCGGCSASVKRILESQPQVSSASVNLTTETAIVWPVSEAKVAPNWQKQLGEALANHLTSCGFKSKLRGQGAIEEDSSS